MATEPAEMAYPELVHRLQSALHLESATRRRQEELNARLQGEYDALLKRLAETELHIDRLRLSGAPTIGAPTSWESHPLTE